jgi:hypothetical protein
MTQGGGDLDKMTQWNNKLGWPSSLLKTIIRAVELKPNLGVVGVMLHLLINLRPLVQNSTH